MNLNMVIDFGAIFKDATVAGVPLLIFVLALVQWLKSTLALQGRDVRITAMILGVVFGILYQLAEATGIPATFAGWFTIVVFGLLLGLGASGVYDVGVDIVQKTKLLPPTPPAQKG